MMSVGWCSQLSRIIFFASKGVWIKKYNGSYSHIVSESLVLPCEWRERDNWIILHRFFECNYRSVKYLYEACSRVDYTVEDKIMQLIKGRL